MMSEYIIEYIICVQLNTRLHSYVHRANENTVSTVGVVGARHCRLVMKQVFKFVGVIRDVTMQMPVLLRQI